MAFPFLLEPFGWILAFWPRPKPIKNPFMNGPKALFTDVDPVAFNEKRIKEGLSPLTKQQILDRLNKKLLEQKPTKDGSSKPPIELPDLPTLHRC